MNPLLAFILPYVINGLAISPVGSPVVRVELIYPDGRSSYCSGSLITNRKVLTAGHCIRSYNPQTPTVSAAVVRIDGITYSSDQIRLHPRFKPRQGFNHDLAIVTLSERVSASVVPLNLDTKKIKKNRPYFVYGYGYSNGLTDPEVLRIGTIIFDWWTREILVSNLKPGESSACFGDSGGPVVSDKGIVGVVTAGEARCDRIGSQSLYARINNRFNRQFIKKFGK